MHCISTWDHFVLYCLPHQYYVGPLCIASVPMWDHFVLHCLPHQYLCTLLAPVHIYHFVLHCLPHEYLCGTTLYCISMWDHFALHCLPHQYLCETTLYCISTYVLCIALFTSSVCGTTLHCISTYMGPLCISLFTSSVHMWDHIVLYQYLCGTTLYCTVYFTSTYLDHFVLQQYVYTSSVGLSACVTTLYCTVTVYLINTYVGLLCIASVPMWDHFVLFTSLFTSSVPMWDHIVLYQYICGTTLYCTVYFTSTYLDHFVLQQ